MGNILSFVPREAGKGPSRQGARLAASIIIFPGVRYERRTMMEATGAGTTAAGKATHRHKEPAPLR
jgi:hypothetical protein